MLRRFFFMCSRVMNSEGKLVESAQTASGRDGVEPLAREARAGHLLRRAYHLAREQSQIRLKDHDITVRQSAALQSIAHHGTLSQAEIGEAIGMEPANVHGLVDRLKKKGLISAARDPANPKRMRVRLTKAGNAMIEALQIVAIEAEHDALSKLTAAEQEQFVALLRKMLA